MQKFNVATIAELISTLSQLENIVHMKRSQVGEIVLPLDLQSMVSERLAKTLISCREVTFMDCSSLIEDPLSRLTSGSTLGMMESELRHARLDVLKELQKWRFVPIHPRSIKYFERFALFGIEVSLHVPEAADDIREAGNCIAVGCNTAAVFHLMRVAEHGLRKLAKKVKVTLTHSGKLQLIEYAEWDKVITGVRNEIAKSRSLPSGPVRKSRLEMYSDAADHCVFMKDIWRNAVSHTYKPYKESEAIAVFERVRDFMVFLAVNIWRKTEAVRVKLETLKATVNALE